MRILGRLTVLPDLPDNLDRLEELARNLQWTWNPHAAALFEALDPQLWDELEHNPVLLLQRISQERLDRAALEPEVLRLFELTINQLERDRTSWFENEHAEGDLYAYFCAEYGWHESVPLYSGGLGVLAGDHTKAASDLGVPLVGVGLWYPEGYFHQMVAESGEQQATYVRRSPQELPLELARDSAGEVATVPVELFGRQLQVRAWRVSVGRVPVYLLDVDFDANGPEDREILKRLYGGDQRTRIAQETILGVGGVRMLRELGIAPTAWHMNEGHSAFMALERCRELVARGVPFEQARELVTASTLFTLHTPVAAGNDAFSFDLVAECLNGLWEDLGLSIERFMELATADHGWGPVYSMPALALRFSSARNGVAQLHGETSRLMWSDLWPDVPVDEVPIGHVTNGVHTGSWMAPQIAGLAGEVLGDDWRQRLTDAEMWQRFTAVEPARLWQVRKELKLEAVRFLRGRLQRQLERHHAGSVALRRAEELFDPEALTIGFARRFATYKRATLIFRDLDRLAALLGDQERPVQLVFAGKAHPADKPGQELIQHIQRLSADPRFAGRILFVEDYDIAVGRALTRGVDVWLNNPRRPLEASGTSGQKAAMNGILNLSILDGWWPEGFDGSNGWAFGSEAGYRDDAEADAVDAEALYGLLEREVVPLYYRRDAQDVPVEWLKRSADAIATITPGFNAQRMVRQYVDEYYAPASERGRLLNGDASGAAQLAQWRERVQDQWPEIYLSARRMGSDTQRVGDEVRLEVVLHTGDLKDVEVRVEAVYSREEDELQHNLRVVPMEPGEKFPDGGRLYTASFRPQLTGTVVYGVRAYPVTELLASPFDAHAIRWA